MIFALYDSASGGNQLGSPITSSATLANGLFTLNLDFGNVFTNGTARYLDITITNGGMTQELSPRVQILPSPYALYSSTAGTAANLASGTWSATAGTFQGYSNVFGISANNSLVLGLSTNGVLVNGKLQAGGLSIGSDGLSDDGNGGLDINNGDSNANLTINNLTLNGDTVQFPAQSGANIAVNGSGDFTFDNNVRITSLGLISLPTPDGGNISLAANGFGSHNISIDGSITVNSLTMPTPDGGDTSITANNNGVYIPGGVLTVNGPVDASAFNTTSDRNLKEKFAPVNSLEILHRVAGLPISNWNFKTDEATRHIGPMAQDFYAAFNVGMDDKHIATVDEDGVALAAIQGLNEKLTADDAQKDAQIKALEQRLSDLEQLVKASVQK
jgi:hypothetical protein